MRVNMYLSICLLILSLGDCTQKTPVLELEPELPYEPTILLPNEPSYPQPVTKQAFYFVNTLDIIQKTREIETATGIIHVSYQLLETLKDDAIKEYLNYQIEQKMDELIAHGIPKYPGIISEFTNNKIEKFTIESSIDAKNNIISVYFDTKVEFSAYKSIRSSSIHHYDLLSGQKISINNIMNSNTGLEDLNHVFMKSLDTFVDPADIEENASLYKAPFQQSFRGLSNDTSIYLYPAWPFAVILNEQCTACYFPWQYGSMIFPYWIQVQNSTIYDRYYQTDLANNATDGNLNLYFGKYLFTKNYFSNTYEIIDSKRNIQMQLYDVPKTDAFYLTQKKLLIQELLVQLNKIEKSTKWTPNVQDSIYLNYDHTEKILSITIDYFLKEGDRYLSSSIQRTFRGDTKAPILLADLFDSQFDYKSFLVTTIQKQLRSQTISIADEMILSNLDSMQFSINTDSIRLSFPITDDQDHIMNFLELVIPYKEIGIDQLSPYLRQAPKEK